MTTQEDVGTTQPRTSQEHIELVERTTAHNYHPLPVVVAEAEGCWVTDVEGRRYLDMLRKQEDRLGAIAEADKNLQAEINAKRRVAAEMAKALAL